MIVGQGPRSWVTALALSVIVAGCAPQALYVRQMEFDAAEYEPFRGEGTGTIIGQAFMKTKGGDVKLGAGNMVWMNPVTSYSTEWFNESVLKQRGIEPADPRIYQFHWETIADGEGRFKFEKVPAGEYYVVCLYEALT